MKIDLRDGISQELAALKACLHFTEGNSKPEKVVLWVFMAMFAIGGIGLFFGWVDLGEPNAAALWTLLVAAMSGLLADARRQEIERLKK